MTRFGPIVEPIPSPTPGGYATSYATDAGSLEAITEFPILLATPLRLEYICMYGGLKISNALFYFEIGKTKK